MLYIAELVFKSYMPKTLEIGQLYIRHNLEEDEPEIWSLTSLPKEPFESFITTHGAPVEPYIIDPENDEVIAEPHQIAWMDDGEEFDDLRDMDVDDMNYIINYCDGLLEIEIDENDNSAFLYPVIYEGKATVCYLGTYDNDEYE
jgi:hypothetical protein